MSRPYKIAIAGIGGVGGYYGGLLANTYKASTEVEVNFVARGEHMLAIKQHGLQLNRDQGNIVVYPHSITDNPKDLGKQDLIIFCCKAYDLEQLALSFSANITEETILLPLLNGVDSTDVLQRLFPQARVLYGCTYLVSKVISPAVIQMMGEMNQLLFGNPAIDRRDLEKIEAVLKATGINVSLHEDIKQKVWEKFSFISPLATATSALNSSVDAILADDKKRMVLSNLMQEIVLLAKAEGLHLPDNIIEVNLSKMEKLPAGATSSMHNDFKNGKRTELETLTGFVVRQAEKLGIDLPVYAGQYSRLKGQS